MLAGGTVKNENPFVFEAAARLDDPDWGIIQSPFMKGKARTLEFRHKVTLDGDQLSYSETTNVEIYGRVFETTVLVFVRASTPQDSSGRWSFWVLVGVAGLIWATQPGSPPPPTSNAVAGVALTLWLLPVWGRWIDRHRQSLPRHTRP